MTFKKAMQKALKAAWAYIKIARIELIVLAAILALDLITKGIVQATMREGQSITVIPKLINFHYVINENAAMGFDFGLGKAARIVFLILTVPALGAFCYFMFRFRGKHILSRVTFAMIIAGTLGNFYDRLFVQNAVGNFGVRDFIQFDFNFFPFIFNIADIALTSGVILFAIYFIFMYKPPKPELVGPVYRRDWKPEKTEAAQIESVDTEEPGNE